MQPLAERDYFSDHSILRDPYAYFEAIRAKGPIYTLPGSGIVVVTGYDEMLEVLRNTADFSSVLAPEGPAAPLPFEPQGPGSTPPCGRCSAACSRRPGSGRTSNSLPNIPTSW